MVRDKASHEENLGQRDQQGGGEFSFCPYIYTPPGVVLFSLYDKYNRDIVLTRRDNLEPLTMVMVAVLSPGMLSYKLESGEGTVLYCP